MTGTEIAAPEATSGVTSSGTGSLRPVLRIIPAECYDNPTWKGLAYFGRDVIVWAAVLVALAATNTWWLVIPLWILSGFTVSALFVLGHDAAHGALFKSDRMNSVVGHLAMLPSWHVYEAWILGHNRIHHGFTVRQGMDFVWHPLTIDDYQALPAWKKARHRMEWGLFGAGPYYLREVWWNKMIRFSPPARWAKPIRRDQLILAAMGAGFSAVLLFAGASIEGSLLGALWFWVKLFVVPFLLFNIFIGWTVHMHHIRPDIRWWSGKDWNRFRGQMEGTTILRAPMGFNFFFHQIFVHVPHHVDMRIPFYELDHAAAAIKAAYPDDVHDEPLRFRDYLRNLKACKLYDFELGRWMTYAEARQIAPPT